MPLREPRELDLDVGALHGDVGLGDAERVHAPVDVRAGLLHGVGRGAVGRLQDDGDAALEVEAERRRQPAGEQAGQRDGHEHADEDDRQPEPSGVSHASSAPLIIKPEPAVERLGGVAAHLHASQEDLEVLHDLADLGVDGQLEGDRAGIGVYPQEALFGGVVHAVVDVETDLPGLAHAAAMHVGLVGEDHRGRDRAHGHAVGLLVVRDGRQHLREVGARQLPLQRLVHEERAGLRVRVTREHVPDVVEVAGHAREVRVVLAEPEPVQHLIGDVRDEVRVAEAVLGEAQALHHAVGGGDEAGQLLVVLDLHEGDRRRAVRRAAPASVVRLQRHRLRAGSRGSGSSPSAAGSRGSVSTRRRMRDSGSTGVLGAVGLLGLVRRRRRRRSSSTSSTRRREMPPRSIRTLVPARSRP